MIVSVEAAKTLRAGMSRVARTVPWAGPRLALRVHRMGLGAAALSWAEVADLVEQERPRALSVDVFDTCVARDLVGDAPIELAIDRCLAGRGAAAGDGAQTSAREAVADRLEASLCRAVPGVVDALNRIRRAGVGVTFLSDTERSSASLQRLLGDLGLYREGDRLVASCEAGATKSDGDLYAVTWDSGREQLGEVWHVGNNYWSDVTMAEQAGLRPIPFVDAEPTRYEEAMAARPATAGPAVAGAARRARLAIVDEAEDPTADSTLLEVIGADVAGQAFGACLLWAAERARDYELTHLAFLARDGELLLDMARAMPEDHWEGRTLSYLHCSRWSWLLAGAATHGIEPWLAAGTSDVDAFIHANRHVTPFGSLLGRIGLRPADLGGHSRLAAMAPDRPLPEEAADEWVALLADPAVGELIEERAHERLDLIHSYLANVGLPRGRIGLVDVGWRGRLAWAMSPIVESVAGEAPIHLHFGASKVHPEVADTADIERFAFGAPGISSRIDNPVSCVEALSASGRARVVGYAETDDGVVEPVFEREVAEIHNTDRQRCWNGALRTAAALPSSARLREIGCAPDSLAPEAVEVLARWWTEPTRAEGEAMRGLSFEADDDGQTIRPLLAPYSPKEIAAEERQPRQWRQGSVVVTSRPFALALVIYGGIGSFLRRFR